MSITLQKTKIRDYFSKIGIYFTGINEPIYRDSKAWADHQEWLKHNKSHINQNQGFLVMHRTAKEAVLLELPLQAQNKCFAKRNAQLIAAQQKDPARQRHKELCRQVFANLPAYKEDSETGLIYANARYLDPKTSRWLSADPARADGTNWYGYVRNNPLKYTDPTGQAAFLLPLLPAAVAALAEVAPILILGLAAAFSLEHAK